ncbi:MAG: hypothetical protein PHU85_02190 [Phycisphaerae bacterium]|nr:hypothetical protein [Phycisphaerae bacterium]
MTFAVLMASAAALADSPKPGFTRKPTATKTGDRIMIEFAVDRETDVAVFIEDAAGKVVRHFVTGVHAPAPLKSDSLAQSVEWDGKADYGKPANGGPFKVRVALGMGAKYDRVLLSDPNTLGGGKKPLAAVYRVKLLARAAEATAQPS